MYELRCPKCKKIMRYHRVKSEGVVSIFLSSRKKACVYCGKIYKVNENVVRVISR